MIEQCLGFWTPGSFELILLVLMFGLFVVGPIVAIVLIVKAVLRDRDENVRLRLEVGKIADELEKSNRDSGGQENGLTSEVGS